jgi:hypothetical protein
MVVQSLSLFQQQLHDHVARPAGRRPSDRGREWRVARVASNCI